MFLAKRQPAFLVWLAFLAVELLVARISALFLDCADAVSRRLLR